MKLSFQPANPYVVQLDIDHTDDLVLFHKHILWLSCIMNESRQPLRGFSETRSRSGKHWHVEIRLSKPRPVMWRIALAAIMGSDRARELCNFERVQFGSKYPILFWKKNGTLKALAKPVRSGTSRTVNPTGSRTHASGKRKK